MITNQALLKLLCEYKNSTIFLLDHVTSDDEKTVAKVSKNVKKRDILVQMISMHASLDGIGQDAEVSRILREIMALERLIEEKIQEELGAIKNQFKKNSVWKEPLMKYYKQISMGPVDERK